MLGLSASEKNELLHRHGVNYNDLPSWQKRGSGLYWEAYEKAGHNPLTGEPVRAPRRRVKRDTDLPMRDAYDDFVAALVRDGGAAEPV